MKYKVGQLLAWRETSTANISLVRIVEAYDERYFFKIESSSRMLSSTITYNRLIEQLDSYDNVSAYIEPNKIWKELNEVQSRR